MNWVLPAVVAVALSACNSGQHAKADLGVILATWANPTKDPAYMTALQKDATFIVENRCVRVQPLGGHGSYLAIFPHGYSIAEQGDGHQILTKDGTKWGNIGVTQDIGGGAVASIDLSRIRSGASACAGPYWVVDPYCVVGKRLIEMSCPKASQSIALKAN